MMASNVAWVQARQVALRARRAEARRRAAVAGVFAIYALALIEGPLRKWLLPGLSTPLIFLRDPFVVLLYAYCFRHGLIAWSPLARLWIGMGIVTSLLGLLQYQFNNLDPFGWLLGVRTYWLYVPLPFVLATTFRLEDVHRFLFWNALLAIPYAVLVGLQYNAGPTAWINIGVGGDENVAVRLGSSIVRPFGLFTYTTPNVDFTAASVAFFLAFYLSGARVPMRSVMLWGSGVAVATMAVLTGSRKIYFFLAVILALTLAGSTVANSRNRTPMQNFGILSFVGIAAVLLSEVFPDMYAAMEARFEHAARSEGSIFNRAFGTAFAFIDPLFTAPLLGYGIGIGAPGVANYLKLPHLFVGENDLQRNINELGIIAGSIFVFLRISTVAWLTTAALKAARRRALAALPLAGYVVVPLAVGQITHSPLIGFLPWLTTGLVMCLIRYSRSAELGQPSIGRQAHF